MIWPTDGFRLAITKVKTRRIRLGITLFISSLLFAGLAAVLFTVRGVVGTINDFSKEGLGARYVVAASPQAAGFMGMSDPTVIARAKVLEKEYIAKRKAEAKRLGIEYDATGEQPAVTQFDGPNGKEEILNQTVLPAKQALEEYYKANPNPGTPELEASAKPYDMLASYFSTGLPFGESQNYLQALLDGKEDYSQEGQQNPADGSYSSIKNFYNSWQSFSDDLLLPFVLPGQSLAQGTDGAIPILAPYSSLEQVLELEALPKSANTKSKLDRLQEVRTKAAGYSFQVCFRNSTSVSRLNTAISQQDELTRNKTNKEYVKPDLIYKLPSEPCGDVGVERDVRTADTKKFDAKQEEFRRIFGEPAPFTRVLTFKIVGIVPDSGESASSTVQQILQSLLTSSIGNGWFTPSKAIAADPQLTTLFTASPVNGFVGQYYAEFGSADSARRFLDEQTCNPDFSFMSTLPAGSTVDVSDPFAACAAEGKYFYLSPFGSNSLALEDFERGFNKFFRIFVIIVMVVASLIMMGIVARIIADSRRETAVFRAIGAKRLDIAQIYLTYVVIICAFIGVLATLGGILVGNYLQSRFGADMQVAASIAFNASDVNRAFSFSRITSGDLVTVWGVIFAVGGISSILPLLSNLRRNPINDMRDDR
jgi:hypothetical protein